MEDNSHSDLSTQVASSKMYSMITQTALYQGEDTITNYWDNSSDANSNATENIQSVVFQRYVAPLVFGCISVVGIVGNGLVIIVLLKYANMRTIPNVYILSLALMDFMFVLCLPMLGYQFATNDWPFGYFMCKLVPGIDGFNQFGSVNIMTMMSADRYVAVVYPLSSMRYRTKKTARIVCGGVFVISFLLCTPSWYFMEYKFDFGITFCTAKSPEWDENGIYYTLYYACFGFLIPLVIIIVCYSTLLFKILGSKLRIRSDGTGTAQRASKRVSILTVSVIVVFVVCWLPYYIVQLVHQFSPEGPVSHAFRVAYAVSSLWCYTNSCFNPIVYTFIGENFKKNVMHLCPFCTSPDDTKLDRYRSNRESSTYIRGGTLRLHSVQHEAASSPPATNATVVTDATSFMEAPANVQTYTFSNNNTHNSCGKE